ncbi:MAG: hypothetical protein Q9O24_06910 [Gammaproteobacteria bacterium]|nr:hypothetical protein [Gammaproteobacteria bacterium]
MESIVESVLLSMSSVKKPQRLFLSALFSALMVFQGKATFRNLSRYSSLHEKRLSRWFRRSFDFAQFNRRLLQKELPQKHDQIAAIDASFMKKVVRKQQGWVGFTTALWGKPWWDWSCRWFAELIFKVELLTRWRLAKRWTRNRKRVRAEWTATRNRFVTLPVIFKRKAFATLPQTPTTAR